MVAIVKDMTIGWSTLARVGGAFNVQLSAANSRIWTKVLEASSVGSDHWTGYLVLPAGETLRVNTAATGTLYFTASGYEFQLP